MLHSLMFCAVAGRYPGTGDEGKET